MSEKILYFISFLSSKLINFFGHKPKQPKRILVIKLDEIGDLVTALHVYEHLHLRYPSAQIETQVRSFNKIFFKHIEYVSTIESPSGQYDLIVDLRGNYSSIRYALWNMPWYRLDRGAVRMINKFSGGQTSELITNFNVIKPLLSPNTEMLSNSITISELERSRIDEFLKEKNISSYAVLHLGARDLPRRWPIDRYQLVIQYLNQEGIVCLLAGGDADRSLNDSALDGADLQAYNVAGTFDLLEFAALCSKAKLFVGNESGPLHIAAAMGTPLVALFGPGVKDVFYPQGDQVYIHHYFLARGHTEQNMENSTIFKITVEEVRDSIDKLLKN